MRHTAAQWQRHLKIKKGQVFCCPEDLLKHVEQIHRIQIKRWQFTFFHSMAIQHKYQNHNTAWSSLSVNARHAGASPRSEPSWQTLHMLCIRCNKGAFCQGLFVAFEAMLISMYIHCYHIFNIRLKPFFLTDITFILTSVWLHFIGALRFWRRLMVTTPLREKDGILTDEHTWCTLQFYGNNIRQDIHLSDWYIHLYEMDLSEKSFKYLHVSEVVSERPSTYHGQRMTWTKQHW